MNIKEILKRNKTIHQMGIYVKQKLAPNQDKVMDITLNYYKDRFLNYSGAFFESEEKDTAYMTWLYHVVEKGLSMPNMRPGFGKEKLLELCGLIEKYANKYGTHGTAFLSAIAVVKEYERVHESMGYAIDTEVKNSIQKIQLQYPDIEPINQKNVTEEEYFSLNEAPFSQFSYSRHCVRNFDTTKSIEINQIIDAINLAKNAPSACNRQPSRVHIITNKKMILSCLNMQNGSRGFKELTDKLLIITGDLRTVLSAQEFFDLNTNVGIFVMNLCYALHLQKIGCCILNWYALPKDDLKLRKIAHIPEEENIVCFIACGKVPNSFKLAESPRNEVEKYYTLHN